MGTCAGGGRIDLGILRYADQAWPSENTDPNTRLFIQDGFSRFYPPSVRMSWVTDSPKEEVRSKRPLAYRFHCAMCGGLGIGADISKCSDDGLEEYAHWIVQYKNWRHIIQRGEPFRLIPPGEDLVCAIQYMTAGRREALVFLFVSHPSTNAESRVIRLRGLDPSIRYATDEGDCRFGSTLTNAGLLYRLYGDFQSRVIYLKGNTE
jgi:alpha-galactosidase